MNFWSDRLRRHASERPGEIVFSDERWSTDFRSLNEFQQLFIGEIKTLGLPPGSRIILALPRSVELASLITALISSEVSGLIVDRSQLKSSLQTIQSSFEAGLILCLKEDISLVQSSLGSLISDFDFLEFEAAKNYSPKPMMALVKKATPAPSIDAKWFLQTSGSTGSPKLVMIGTENLIERAQFEIRDFKLCRDDRLLNSLTFAHDLGLNQVLSVLVLGIELRLNTGPLITSLAKALIDFRPTGITGTPMMWRLLLSSVDSIFTGLRYVTVSGGSLEKKELSQLQDRFPTAEIFRTYGQTETFRTLFQSSKDDDSQGSPLVGVSVRLQKPDGTACARDEEGELFHQGSGAMMGYWKDADGTRAKITANGIATGDIFRKTAEDTYVFVGRTDDTIKRFEQRFQISEIENVLRSVEGVTEAVVAIKPSATNDPRQLLLCAFIEFRSGPEARGPKEKKSLEVMLSAHCKHRLTQFKIPDRYEILESLPRTASLKPDRAELGRRWRLEKP